MANKKQRQYYIGNDRDTVFTFGESKEEIKEEAEFLLENKDNYTLVGEVSTKKITDDLKATKLLGEDEEQTSEEANVIFADDANHNPDDLLTDQKIQKRTEQAGDIIDASGINPVGRYLFGDYQENIASWLISKGTKIKDNFDNSKAVAKLLMGEELKKEDIPQKTILDKKNQKRLDDQELYTKLAIEKLKEQNTDEEYDAKNPEVIEEAKKMWSVDANYEKLKDKVIEKFYDGDSSRDLDNYSPLIGKDQQDYIDLGKLAVSDLKRDSKVSIATRDIALENLKSTKTALDLLSDGKYTTQEELDKAQKEYKKLVSEQKVNISNFKMANENYKVSLETLPELQQYVDLHDKNYNLITQAVGGFGAAGIDILANTSNAIGYYMDFPIKLAIESDKVPASIRAALTVMDYGGYNLSDIPVLGGNSFQDIADYGLFADDIRKELGATTSFNNIDTFSDFGEYVTNLTATQVPQFALMMAAPQIALPILSLSSAGAKFKSIQEEIDNGADYSVLDMYLGATMTGAVEYASERVTMKILKQNQLTGNGLKEARQGGIKFLKNDFLSLNTAKQLTEEGLSEVYATFGENFADKFVLGKKDVNLTEGVGEAFFSGAFLAGTLFKMPVVAKALKMPFFPDSQGLKYDKNADTIFKNSLALANPKLDPEVRKILEEQNEELVAENIKINLDTFSSINYLKAEEKQDLLDIYTEEFDTESKIKILKAQAKDLRTPALRNLEIKLKQIKLQKETIIQPALDQHFEDIKEGVVKILDTSGKQLGINEIQEVENWDSINKKIELENKSKSESEQEALVDPKDSGYIMTNPDGTKTIVLNKNVAVKDGNINVAAHELLHGILDVAFKNDPAAKADFGKSVATYLQKINTVDLKNTSYGKRLNAYFNMIETGEYSEANAYEEAITLLSDSLVSGDLKYNPSALEIIGGKMNKIARAIGLKSTNFTGGKDVLSFVLNFNKSISEGELIKEVQQVIDKGAVAKAKETKQAKEARNRKSINISEQKINNLVGPRSLKTGKYTWKSKAEFQNSIEFANLYSEVVEGNIMDALIMKGVNPINGKIAGQSVDFYKNSVKDQIALLLIKFDPTINNSLSGYINSLLFKKKGTVLKKLAKIKPEISRDRTRSDGSSILMDSVDDAKLQDELLDDQLNSDAELEGKDALREGLGLDNTLVDDILAATEQSYFDNLSNIGSVSFITQLSQSAIKILKGPVLQLMGKGDAYIKINANGTLANSFIKKYKKLLLNNLSIAQLVSLERLNKNKIFASPVKKLTTQAEIDKAVDKGLIVVKNDKSSPILYKQLNPSDAQLIEFFNPPLTNPKTGKVDNTKGNRKIALRNAIITALTLNATPDVTRDLFDNSIKNPLSIITNRNPNKRFSRSISDGTFEELNSRFRQLKGAEKIQLTQGFDVFFDKLSDPSKNIEIAWSETYGDFLLNKNGKPRAIKYDFLKGFKKLKEQFVGETSLNFVTGKVESITLKDFLYRNTEGMNPSAQIETMLGLKKGSINYNDADQIQGVVNAIGAYLTVGIKDADGKIVTQGLQEKNGWTDLQTIEYLVNVLGPGFYGAAKVGNESLNWKKDKQGVMQLVKTNVKKGTLRYGFFSSSHQMIEVLFPNAFGKNGIVAIKEMKSEEGKTTKKLINKNTGKPIAKDISTNTSKAPYLKELKDTGELSDTILNKSNDYAESHQEALLDFITFLKDQKGTYPLESVGMIFTNSAAHTSSAFRKGAPVNYIAGFEFNGELDDYRYEHNPPVKVMKTYAVQYYMGELTKAEFQDKLNNFSVGIIPIFMDNALDLVFKDNIPTPGTGVGRFRRLYNNSTWGLFPFVTTFYNPNNDFKPETVGEGAPQAFEYQQEKDKADEVLKTGRKSIALNPPPKDPNKPDKLSKQFNKIIEQTLGVDADKGFSSIVAKRRGGKKGKFRPFVPPSMEDFQGLMYDLYARGKLGEKQMQWVKENLIDPYQKGVANIDIYRQVLKQDYKGLLKKFPNVKKNLGKIVPETDFTYDQAIRVYLWTQAGFEIPGISKRDAKKLNDFVNNNIELTTFAKSALLISKKDQWSKPDAYWDVQSILSDLNNFTNNVGRNQFLEEFNENVEAIFSKENLNKLEATLGTNWRSAMEDSLYRMQTGTNRPSGTDKLVNSFMNWTNNSIGAIMFFNRKSALLQTISSVNFLNWSDNNPVKAAMAFANFPQFVKDFAFLWNSPKLKQRRAGLRSDVNEAEIANAVRGATNKAQAMLSYLLKLGFTPTQLADSFAIASGGATFYRNRLNTYKKQGFSEAEASDKAFSDFSATSEVSQQSADPMFISQQQAGVLGRLILAFQNTPAQVTRLFKKATRDFINFRGDQKTNISKMVYYGAIQGFIFAALQNAIFMGMDEEDEEEDAQRKKELKQSRILNSMTDTLLRGSGVYGAIVATLKNTINTYYRQKQKSAFAKDNAAVLLELANLSPPIGSKLRKINNALKQEDYKQDVMDKMNYDVTYKGKVILSPKYNIIASTTEGLTNIPLERAMNEFLALSEMMDQRNSTMQRIALALGYRAWDVGAKIEEFDEIKIEAKEDRAIATKERARLKREEAARIKEAKKYEGKSPSQIKLIKRKKVIYDQTKKQQVDELSKLGLTKAQIKSLKYEKDRVNKIIELQNKK